MLIKLVHFNVCITQKYSYTKNLRIIIWGNDSNLKDKNAMLRLCSTNNFK